MMRVYSERQKQHAKRRSSERNTRSPDMRKRDDDESLQ
jgi:hypothetical protein